MSDELWNLQQKWKSFVQDNIVTGWELEHQDISIDRLDKIIAKCNKLKQEINTMVVETDDNIEELLVCYKEIKRVYADCSLDWHKRYNKIFDDGLCVKFRELCPNFHYYDPDFDYEDDVTAFFDAAKEYIQEKVL